MRLSATTRISLLLDAAIVAVFTPALLGAHYPLVLPYEVHKLLHIVGAVLFLGNMTVGPIWLIYAVRGGEIATVRFALRLLGLTDVLLSLPGLLLLALNGLCMATVYGGIYAVDWLRETIALLGLMLLVAVTVVLYYQERLYELARSEEGLSPAFWRAFWRWGVWGTLVMVPPVIVLYLMVVKRGIF